MDQYIVQITIESGEEFVLQIMAGSEAEAEMTAIMMVESGETQYGDAIVVDCFCV